MSSARKVKSWNPLRNTKMVGYPEIFPPMRLSVHAKYPDITTQSPPAPPLTYRSVGRLHYPLPAPVVVLVVVVVGVEGRDLLGESTSLSGVL